MTRWPTLVDTYVCETLNELFATATTIMARASRVSSPVRPWGRATSMIARIRNGLTSETSDEAATSTPTKSRFQRYGRNSATIRRSGTRGLACGTQ